jgi:hypothetical protein
MSANMPQEQFAISIVAIAAVFGLPFLGLMIWMMTHYVCATFKFWQELALKREMVARGYTVQEIVDVVAAKRGNAKSAKSKAPLADLPPAKPVKPAAYGA